MKISVCMATYNGSKYIRKQISSILEQLDFNDELIISDDGSTDDTIQIVRTFNDDRIILLKHKKREVVLKGKIHSHYLVSSNFENALKKSTGDVIFLADQDDVWANNKVSVMLLHLKKHSLVMSNFIVINEDDKVIGNSFFSSVNLPRGLLNNIIKPLYHGCCMGFRREVLDIALPFPSKMILHDSWIGILAEKFYTVKFIEDELVLYRRHSFNSSSLMGKSTNSLIFRIKYRIVLFFQLVKRIISFRFNLVQ